MRREGTSRTSLTGLASLAATETTQPVDVCGRAPDCVYTPTSSLSVLSRVKTDESNESTSIPPSVVSRIAPEASDCCCSLADSLAACTCHNKTHEYCTFTLYQGKQKGKCRAWLDHLGKEYFLQLRDSWIILAGHRRSRGNSLTLACLGRLFGGLNLPEVQSRGNWRTLSTRSKPQGGRNRVT